MPVLLNRTLIVAMFGVVLLSCSKTDTSASAPVTTAKAPAVAFVPGANAACREMKTALAAVPKPTASPLDAAYDAQEKTFVAAALPIMDKGRAGVAAASDGSANATAALAKVDAWLAAVKAKPSMPRILVEPVELQDDALVAAGLTDCFTKAKTFVPVDGPVG